MPLVRCHHVSVSILDWHSVVNSCIVGGGRKVSGQMLHNVIVLYRSKFALSRF